jgi:hypothetical protein
MARRAIRGGWVDDETGLAIVAKMCAVVLAPDTPRRDRIAAARVLIPAAAVGARREGNAVQEEDLSRVQAAQAGAAHIRAILETPEGREALARLSRITLTAADPPAPQPDACR